MKRRFMVLKKELVKRRFMVHKKELVKRRFMRSGDPAILLSKNTMNLGVLSPEH